MRLASRAAITSFVAMTLICVTVGTAAGGAPKANVAHSRLDGALVCDYERGSPCTAEAARWSKRKFINNRMGRSKGFDPQEVFTKPREIRRIYVNKIARQIARKRAAVGARVTVTATDRQEAFELFRELRQKSPCVGDSRYEAYSASPDPCGTVRKTAPITKRMVQNTGTAILCGGAVVLGATTSAASAGTTTFIAGWGATSCFWSLWIALDN